jgi:hypothetical protein
MTFCMKLIAVIFRDNFTVSFITLFMNCYNNRLLPLIRQFLVIPNKINELVNHRQ